MQAELLRLEADFTQRMLDNDADAIGRLLSDDWIIVDPDGRTIDKERFLGVIKSGALTHESMATEDLKVRVFRDAAIITGLTTTSGKFMGQAFATQERATDVFIKQDGQWRCVLTQLTPFIKK